MKKSFLKFSLLVVMLIFISSFLHAQRFIVRVRPSAPAVVRIASPGPTHVWIDGEWIWRGNVYVYQPGYWYLPRGRERWVHGHWKATRGGWVWMPGHWKYKRW